MSSEVSEVPARAYVLGGNASTLAFTSSLIPQNGQVTAWLVPLAWTPIGAVVGEAWQRVGVAADNLAGWTDQTFDPSDERSFVTPIRDLELLLRTGWSAPVPQTLSEEVVINDADMPEDVLDALAHPAEALTTCAICRRTCVRDDFVWNDRRLCAWDYHATVFGKRGPWRDGVYEDHHFETLPHAQYVAAPLLAEAEVDAIMSIEGIDEALARTLVNALIAGEPERTHMAVRTRGGYTLLRERERPAAGTAAP